MLNIDAEIFGSQIFYYLQKSSKRKSNFEEGEVLCGKENHKIMKHVGMYLLLLETIIN